MISGVFTWSARILAVLFAVFLAIFSFDVFSVGFSWSTLLGFFIQLLPAVVVAVLLWISWKRAHIGGAIYILAGILAMFFFDPRGWYFTAGPALLVGALFMAGYYTRILNR